MPDKVAAEDFLPLPAAVFHILVALGEGERHGYSIMLDIAARTDNKIRMGPGTLYAAIKRILEQGLIAEVPDSPSLGDDERRRYYRITKLGRRVISAEMTRLSDLVQQAKAGGFKVKPL